MFIIMALHFGPSIVVTHYYYWNIVTINVWRCFLCFCLVFFVLRMFYSIWGYLVLIMLCITFHMFLMFSGIRVILIMTWLCTIETYIWTFLYTNVLLSVCNIFIEEQTFVIFFIKARLQTFIIFHNVYYIISTPQQTICWRQQQGIANIITGFHKNRFFFKTPKSCTYGNDCTWKMWTPVL